MQMTRKFIFQSVSQYSTVYINKIVAAGKKFALVCLNNVFTVYLQCGLNF